MFDVAVKPFCKLPKETGRSRCGIPPNVYKFYTLVKQHENEKRADGDIVYSNTITKQCKKSVKYLYYCVQ